MDQKENKRFNSGEGHCQEVLFPTQQRYSVVSKISVHTETPNFNN